MIFYELFKLFDCSTEPREPPSDVKAYSTSSSEIRVAWKPPSPGPGKPKGYEVCSHHFVIIYKKYFLKQLVYFFFCQKVQFWKEAEQEESGKKQRTMKNETFMILTGLDGNSQYLITVKGFNNIGQGPACAAIKARTKKFRK